MYNSFEIFRQLIFTTKLTKYLELINYYYRFIDFLNVIINTNNLAQ